MRYIQSFWSGPERLGGSGLCGFTGGWLSAEYHWMSWALSSLQAVKLFGGVDLITDMAGRAFLVDILGLPYRCVSTELEGFGADYPGGLWSMAKIHVYGLQMESFLHLDGDLILWERPPEEFLQAPLLCQNIERGLAFYRATLEKVNAHFSFLPVPFCRSSYPGRSIYSCNGGIVRGVGNRAYTGVLPAG